MRRLLAAALLLSVAFGGGQSLAQVHEHPTEVITGEVARFYETWMRPDNPNLSCCNRADCYAAPTRFQNGRWLAKRREDERWLVVPPKKIERNRDSPDGRSHLCAPPPANESNHENGVICLVLGNGT